jgi:catechol 2,3-dioxygenase-like lactoylglutathione lyase family enzyme
MTALDAKAVFYVADCERALRFYTQSLGFALDWSYAPQGRAFVFPVRSGKFGRRAFPRHSSQGRRGLRAKEAPIRMPMIRT